jgi:putative transferase (TIGR04331 family)
MIPKILPKSLVEGYSKNCFNNKKKILARFKMLFAYPSLCDVRNIFIAQQVESGSKIAYFQHGGGYGQAKVFPHEVNEIETSDYFFTWGWSNNVYKKKTDIKKIVKFFHVNRFNKKVNFKKNDKILLVLDNFPYNFIYFRSNPISLQSRFYLDRIKKFILNLDLNLRKKLIVRCYPHNYGVYDFYNILKNSFKDIEIDDGSSNILRLYKKVKCCVFAQNSTSYLESVNLNIPTITFWDDNFYETRSSFKWFMTKHLKNKFYHKTPVEAANFLNTNYDILEKWWSKLNQKKYFQSFVSNYLNQDVERSKKKLTNFIEKINY